MTDRAYDPPEADPFAQIAQGGAAANEDEGDPFAQIAKAGGTPPQPKTSTLGALATGAVRSLIPSAAGFAAFGAGAEAGAAVGGAIGGPFAPVTAPIGGLIGGAITAGIAGTAANKVQDYAVSALPDSWKDPLEKEEQQTEAEHPYASFIGGMLPFALTMRPGAAPAVDLPANATALQRITTNPITKRLFGGAAMGALELGQEKVEDNQVSWPKVAISTAFGVVLNRPTKFGERLTELGAGPARALLGRPSPTIAQAADAKVMGPGVTEDVYQGSQAQDPTAEMTAQETARQEQSLIGTPPAPDLHAAARQMHPELFAHYDDLLARQKSLADWIAEEGADNAPAAAKHLADVNDEINAVQPEVAAAYRRADEAANGPAPQGKFGTMAEMLAAQGREPIAPQGAAPQAVAPEAAPPIAPSLDEQRAFIQNDVAQKLVAAGRPQDEAQNAGAVVAANYEAVARRMEGKLGSPQQLYEREGADIAAWRKGGGAPTPAQPAPPVAPTDHAEPVAAEAPAATNRKGPAQRDPTTFSLLEFIAHHGGIRSDDPLIADLKQSFGGKNKFVPGFGSLIRKPQGNRAGAPMFLDQARGAAVDAGYLHDVGAITGGVTQSTIEDLLQAVDREARGQKVYRMGQEREARQAEPAEAEKYQHERQQFLSELREYAKDKLALTPEEESRALEMRAVEHIHDPAEIIDRLALEIDNREIEGGAGPRDESISGWDELPDESATAPATRGAVAPGEPEIAGGGAARTGGAGAGAEEVEYFQRRRQPEPVIPASPEFVAAEARYKAAYKEFAEAQADYRARKETDFDKATERFLVARKTFDAALKANDEARTAEEVRQNAVREQARKEAPKTLAEQREAEGQLGLPGTERISQAEQVQRKADEPLKPSVEQKPMDEGLFGTAKDQKELFQRTTESRLLKIRIRQIEYDRRIAKQAGNDVDGEDYAASRNKLRRFRERLREIERNPELEKSWADLKPGETFDPEDERILHQGALGKILLRPDRNLISLAKTADASTFIHEFGHDMLDRFTRYAGHEAAPESMRGDMQTIRDYVGNKGEDITTRQHEKFARGFEQYLREGVAPSPGLAGVFAKFRDWLLHIYQSLRGLGPEISPDIRGVFDRMLAAEPQRTVIAPERMERPNLGDIHEVDALHTEPPEAEAAGDRVLSEAQRFIQDLPGGLQNEHAKTIETIQAATAAAHPATEAGTGAGGTAKVEPGGGEPGPVAGGGAGGAAVEPELRGGDNAVPEGVGQPGSGERPGQSKPTDAGLGDKPLAPRPTEQFGKSESQYVDKAGNIRRPTLGTTDDVWKAVKDSADRNEGFVGARQGVVTDGMVLDIAHTIGMDGAENIVKNWVVGRALNAGELVALGNLVKASGADVHAAALKAAETNSTADLLAHVEAKTRHDLIQAAFSGVMAESARATRALRLIKQDAGTKPDAQIIQEATGKTLFQNRIMAKLIGTLDDASKTSKFINDSKNWGFGRMILEYWVNGLISGLATHMTYTVGNEILSLEKAGPETAAAAAIGSLRKAMGRPGETVRLGEVAEQLRSHFAAMPGATKALLDALRTGVTIALPGEQAGTQSVLQFQPHSQFAQQVVAQEAASFAEVMQSAYGVMSGIKDAFKASGALAGGETPLFGLNYSHLGAIPDVELAGMLNLPIGSMVRLPSRMVAGIHSFFRVVNYAMEKNALAYRTAANEGLTGMARDARIGDLRQSPTQEIMEAAHGKANTLTLMGQGGEFTRALSRLTNTPIFGLPILKFIDPFVHISSNIIEQSIIERTPVGLLSPEIRADLSGKNGNVAQDTATARMLMGTVYAVAIGGLAAEGYVSGSEPSDPHQAAIWRLAGNQAHSVRIGDMWYDVHRLGPLGMLMGVAADMYGVAHVASQGDMLTAASNLQHAITQNVLDESFMRGPSDLIKAVDDPGRYGEAYISNFASSFLPYSVGMAQMARAADPYSRQARTVMDSIKQKIPFESQTLLPRRDIWGEPMANKSALAAAGVTAIYEQRMSRDPVNLALLDLGVSPAQVKRTIRNVQLTDQQYDDYMRIAGRMTKMRLDAIVNSPDYRTWPNHIRANVIREVITQSREAARGIMIAKSPSIASAAVAARLQKVSGD